MPGAKRPRWKKMGYTHEVEIGKCKFRVSGGLGGVGPWVVERECNGRGPNILTGRLAQRESTSFTPTGSLVRSQHRPPHSLIQRPIEGTLPSYWLPRNS